MKPSSWERRESWWCSCGFPAGTQAERSCRHPPTSWFRRSPAAGLSQAVSPSRWQRNNGPAPCRQRPFAHLAEEDRQRHPAHDRGIPAESIGRTPTPTPSVVDPRSVRKEALGKDAAAAAGFALESGCVKIDRELVACRWVVCWGAAASAASRRPGDVHLHSGSSTRRNPLLLYVPVKYIPDGRAVGVKCVLEAGGGEFGRVEH